MGLHTYRQKRDFTRTPEPPPQRAVKKGFSYCVQKHDATRLHYDFRLELDGVLKSWAVTRGPSLDPADKRLAVRTEDHPVSYGDFEGTIPKGEYGGGTVMLWDEGDWEPVGDPRTGLKKGHLVFELHGQRLRGRWALIRMRNKDPGDKKENWLLIKEKDAESASGQAAKTFLDRNAFSIKTEETMDEIAAGGHAKKSKGTKKMVREYGAVQLATLVTAPPDGKDWVHEIKLDGYRILCFIDNGSVTIMTRNGNDWTDRFAALVPALSKVKVKSAVLDGEAVLLDTRGITHFQKLQQAFKSDDGLDALQAYFFDLLHLNGRDLRRQPLVERKELLRKLNLKAPLHYSDHFESSQLGLKKACTMGLEGLISKRKDSTYSGTRGMAWLKSKCGKRQEFIIAGYTASKSGNRAVGALHLAYMKRGKLTYAGKVGTGFSVKMAEDMLKILKPLTAKQQSVENVPTAAKRGTTWVKPQILCEVAFTEWTADGHLRHPSFQGLREDKRPEEIVHEKPVPAKKVLKAKKAAKSKEERHVVIDGITISHPDRLIFEKPPVTKAQLAQYYALVGPYMLQEIGGHPISLLRCPSGVDTGCFFQRNPDQYMRNIVKPFSFLHHGKKHEYLYVEDVKGLVFLTQMGVIEIHPWGAEVKKIDHPRRLIFDLDPDDAVPFEAVKLAALDLRARLKKLGLESFLKCTGGKGLHVTVPLAGKQKWDFVKKFSQNLASEMVAAAPTAYVSTMSKQKRKGKILIDFFRNDYTATAIADYSVRARPGAPVAVPLRWEELKGLSSARDFSIADVIRRLKRRKPDMKRYTLKQTLPVST